MTMLLALLCVPLLLLPKVTAVAIVHIENSAEDSIIVEITTLDQQTFLFPRLFESERLCKTILPTIKPVKRTLMAAVQDKKMVSNGIGVIKLMTDSDNVNSAIISKMEKN